MAVGRGRSRRFRLDGEIIKRRPGDGQRPARPTADEPRPRVRVLLEAGCVPTRTIALFAWLPMPGAHRREGDDPSRPIGISVWPRGDDSASVQAAQAELHKSFQAFESADLSKS